MSNLPRSERACFRTWTEADLPLARKLWTDADVMHYLGGPQDEAWVRGRLATEMRHQQEFGFQYWPMFSLADSTFMGCAGLKPYEHDRQCLEVGVHLARPFWSGRYGEEAARAVIAFAFQHLGANTLVVRHHPQNTNSQALVHRLGFVYSHDRFWQGNGMHCPTYFLRTP